MRKVIAVFFVCLMGTVLRADTIWELKKDKEGIKVYTGEVPNSNLKAVRVVCTLNATLSQLAAILMDTKAHEDWVYSAKTSYNLKQISPSEWIYYSEFDMPWPVTNRDVVVTSSISQQPDTRIMHIKASAARNYLPENKDIVRVPLSTVNWTVTPMANNQLMVEYIAMVDPGGNLPAWLVNSFSTKGPFETFKKLQEVVGYPAYAHARFDFIKD